MFLFTSLSKVHLKVEYRDRHTPVLFCAISNMLASFKKRNIVFHLVKSASGKSRRLVKNLCFVQAALGFPSQLIGNSVLQHSTTLWTHLMFPLNY